MRTVEEIEQEIRDIREAKGIEIHELKTEMLVISTKKHLEEWCDSNLSEHASLNEKGLLRLDGNFSQDQVKEILQIVGWEFF